MPGVLLLHAAWTALINKAAPAADFPFKLAEGVIRPGALSGFGHSRPSPSANVCVQNDEPETVGLVSGVAGLHSIAKKPSKPLRQLASLR
jgi:hypothetical protein